MRGVFVDPAARIARAQGGCLLGDVDRETQLHGLAAVLGFVSATGVAGLTLGGGFGYVSRRFGWTSDNVRSMDLVTADGRLVRASENEHPDLFWGLRGGGGNFGVVTAIDFELHPLGPEIVGGPVAWRAESAPEVLEAFRKHANDAPPELSLVAVMRKAPPAPWIDKSAHGQLIVMLLACYTGKLEEGEKLLAPLKALGKPVGDLLQRRPYVTLQSLLDATQPKGPPLLLEVGVPARDRARAAGEAARARRAHPVAALRGDRVPARRGDRQPPRRPLGGRQPGRRRRAQHQPARGRSPRTTPPTSSGRARAGAT
jgi:FAD/FMN-containing dehydrogenase